MPIVNLNMGCDHYTNHTMKRKEAIKKTFSVNFLFKDARSVS